MEVGRPVIPIIGLFFWLFYLLTINTLCIKLYRSIGSGDPMIKRMTKPNFSHSSARKRCETAILACIKFFGTKQRSASKTLLSQGTFFGILSNRTSRYLKNTLLTEIYQSHTKNNKKTKIYKINIQGLNYVREELNGTYTGLFKDYCLLEKSLNWEYVYQVQRTQAQQVFQEHQKELLSSRFTYKKSSSRRYHRLQTISNRYRSDEFTNYGYKYNYDIECCAPTLLLQYARILGLKTPTPAMDYLISNRTQARQQIANECAISVDLVKKIITSVLQGAIISKSIKSSVYVDILEYNSFRLHRVQTNDLMCKLRKEISMMWSKISPHIPRGTYLDKNGTRKLMRMTGKRKTDVYRRLEQVVMKEIDKYLKKQNMKFFMEHDGWRCDQLVDVDQLVYVVRSKTGYNIRFDMEQI